MTGMRIRFGVLLEDAGTTLIRFNSKDVVSYIFVHFPDLAHVCRRMSSLVRIES